MTRPVFGVDIDCPRCAAIHPAEEDCRVLELSDVVWLRRADAWRVAHIGEEATSEAMTAEIGRPYNPQLIGSVWKRWQTLGYVRALGMQTAKSKARHGGTLRRWAIL
jgi:hypothetical protein